MTRTGQCECGAFKVRVEGEPLLVGACSCLPCQRRTGSVFLAGAYFPKSKVLPSGPYKVFVRVGDSGRKAPVYFCPTCGSTLFWDLEFTSSKWDPNSNEEVRGVAVGCFADPSFPHPQLAVFTRSRHPWVSFPPDTELHEKLPPFLD